MKNALIYQQAIRGNLDKEFSFFVSAYKVSNPGEISIFEHTINIRIGTLHYELDNIQDVKIVLLNAGQKANCIALVSKLDRQLKTFYLFDYRYLGLVNFLPGHFNKMMQHLESFKQRTKQ